MPLPDPQVVREPVHTRSVTIQAYKRADGLMDIEARLVDTKSKDLALASGVRPAGEPIHDMSVRLTIDPALNIIDAVSLTERMPYVGFCDSINPAYRSLIGLNLAKGFRKAVIERFGGVDGCTHITEMLTQVPTAAIQSYAGERYSTDNSKGKPFQLDRCHALDTRGPAVERYYPLWHRPQKAAGESD